MKVESEILIDVLIDEIGNLPSVTLQYVYGFFRTHPLVRKSSEYYTLNEISEIVYTVYFKLKNYDDYKIYDLLSNRVFYTVVSFEYINETEETCSDCDGYGRQTCNYCDGSGYDDPDLEEPETCSNCDSEGEVDCYECGGEGAVSGADEIPYTFHLQSDIQPETIINDMERADTLTDEFEDEISDSIYQFTVVSSEYMYLNENDYEYDNRYEGQVLFYEVEEADRNILINRPLLMSLN